MTTWNEFRRPRSHAPPEVGAFLLPFLGLLAAILFAGCGGGGGGGGTVTSATATLDDAIVYKRFRDPVTGDITPVLAESGVGFDSTEVDSPAIAVDAARLNGDRFLLYYEATDAGGTNTVGLMTSGEEDFLQVQILPTQVISTGGPGSGFEAGATDPSVVVDKRAAENPNRRYKMWFEGRSGAADEISTIIYCVSADGVNWSGFTPCLGLDPSFGSVRVADPTVLIDDDTYKVWFEAIDSPTRGGDGPGVIGYAESSDGIQWLIQDADGNGGALAGAVFGIGAPGNFDAYSVGSPSVILDKSVPEGSQGRFKLWYEAGDNPDDTENTIGFAVSVEGLLWSDPTLPILTASSDSIVPLPFDSGDLEHPSATIVATIPEDSSGHFLLYYTGDGENNATPNRIGLALGRRGP